MQALILQGLIFIIDWDNRVLKIDLGDTIQCLVNIHHLIFSVWFFKCLSKELFEIPLYLLNQLWKVEYPLLPEFNHRLFCEVRHIYKYRLIKPRPLYYHLHQMNQIHCRFHVSFICRYINHTLQHSDRLIQHHLGVCEVVSNGQWTPLYMTLDKQVGFHVGILQVVLGDLNGDQVHHALVQDVLVVPDGEPEKLLGVG